MLRVEDIHHRPDTKDRLDKAAATQLVFEDAMIHVVDHLLRVTGANRLVLTGGVALNAVGNMRLLEHFDEAWFAKAQQRKARLHLWVPPVPGDPGVTIGAAWLFAHLAGAPRGAPMTHAFYCGSPPSHDDIASALEADDIASQRIGDISTPEGRDAIADLMAFMVAQNGVIALYQGAAETGPRALGHRSILANPCDAEARERLNERVKYREAIRPLAPMATLEAAQEYFELLPGASDADYNAYNYMVLTAQSKPHAREKIPAVIHADGTGRIQIVRAEDDPLTYAYLKALGRHIGVEMSVNTSFNVAGPIAQTPQQAIDTLRRSKGLDVVLLVAERRRGPCGLAWRRARQRAIYRLACGMEEPAAGRSALKEFQHAPVDQQQRAADHQRAGDLAQRNLLAQHQISEQDRGHRNQQRHQHDVGRAGAPQDLKEHDVGERGRQRRKTDHREPGRQRPASAIARGVRRRPATTVIIAAEASIWNVAVPSGGEFDSSRRASSADRP